MSVATLDDYGTLESKKDSQEINAERNRILNTVFRKAQDQTLTLQETTDLYEKFNSTYNKGSINEKPQDIDESWALELLQECEKEELITVEEPPVLRTRINGLPSEARTQASINRTTLSKPANDSHLLSAAAEHENGVKLNAKNLQTDISEHFSTAPASKQHNAFAAFIITSSLVTVGILLGFSVFF